MEKGKCELKSSPKEIEYSNEDNEKKLFLKKFYVHIFFNFYFAYSIIFFKK